MTRYQQNIQLYLITGDLEKDMRLYLQMSSLNDMISYLHTEDCATSLKSFMEVYRGGAELFTNGSPNTIVKKYMKLLNKCYE